MSRVGTWKGNAVKARNSKPSPILLLVFFFLPAAGAVPPTAAELLDTWTRTLDRCSAKSFIAKGRCTSTHEYKFTANPRRPGMHNIQDSGTSFQRVEYRTDGRCVHLREYSWGHISPDRPSVTEEQPSFYCLNYGGEKEVYRHSQRVGEPGGAVMISKVGSYEDTGTYDSRLQGYLLPSRERTDAILRKARSLSVRPKTERVDDRDYYVLEAQTDSGRITLWLDPARGCHPAKAEVVARGGDLENGQPLGAGQVHTLRFDGFRHENVAGVWMPLEVKSASDLNYGDGSFTRAQVHYRRTSIQLNPDHAALGSFWNPLEHPENDPELKNGAHVRKSDDRTRYLWKDGKLVPDERQPGGKSSRQRGAGTPNGDEKGDVK
jgi:hypothetical protein